MDQRCYWPDATITDEDYIPCVNITSSGSYTACCGVGHYCFSNGLCLDNGGMTTYRGGCTDRSWNSADCPQYCEELCPGSICGVWPCDGIGHFACTPSDCGSTSTQIVIPAGIILLNAAVTSDLRLTVSSTTSNSKSTQTPTHTPTTTTTTPSHLSSSNATTDISTRRCESTGALAGIGVGIGLPLTMALIIVSVLLFREKRKNNGSPAPVDGGESDLVETGMNGGRPKWMPTSPYRDPGFQEAANSPRQQVGELDGLQITRTA